MITREEIQTISKLLASNLNINKILLFESYASGHPTSESDLDLCITADLQNRRKIDFVRDIRRIVMDQFQIPMDILVYDDQEFSQRATQQNTMEYHILNQGILLNG